MCDRDCGRCEDCDQTDTWVDLRPLFSDAYAEHRLDVAPTPPTTMPPMRGDGGETP